MLAKPPQIHPIQKPSIKDHLYDHHWRTYRALDMDGLMPRPVQWPELGPIREVPDVGGLHHHDERRAA
jgi:hypothetical protein